MFVNPLAYMGPIEDRPPPTDSFDTRRWAGQGSRSRAGVWGKGAAASEGLGEGKITPLYKRGDEEEVGAAFDRAAANRATSQLRSSAGRDVSSGGEEAGSSPGAGSSSTVTEAGAGEGEGGSGGADLKSIARSSAARKALGGRRRTNASPGGAGA